MSDGAQIILMVLSVGFICMLIFGFFSMLGGPLAGSIALAIYLFAGKRAR